MINLCTDFWKELVVVIHDSIAYMIFYRVWHNQTNAVNVVGG